MESVSIPVGYGVELSTLLDTAARCGLDGIAQVGLGSRAHKHQTDHDLALMAAELLVVAERRRPEPGGPWPANPQLQQFVREGTQVRPVSGPVRTEEGPPVADQLPSRAGGQR